MDRSSRRGQFPRNGSMISTRQPLRIPTDINNDEQPDGLMKTGKMTSASSARSSTASDAQSGLYETIDDEGGIYDQGGIFLKESYIIERNKVFFFKSIIRVYICTSIKKCIFPSNHFQPRYRDLYGIICVKGMRFQPTYTRNII